MDIRTIKTEEGAVLAIIYSRNLTVNGVRFLTPQTYPLQVGLIQHKKGKIVGAHKHAIIVQQISQVMEFIYIEKGKALVRIYDNDFKLVSSEVLRKGDFMLQVGGGHSFTIKKDSRLIEVKQGPYPGDDKAKIYATKKLE